MRTDHVRQVPVLLMHVNKRIMVIAVIRPLYIIAARRACSFTSYRGRAGSPRMADRSAVGGVNVNSSSESLFSCSIHILRSVVICCSKATQRSAYNTGQNVLETSASCTWFTRPVKASLLKPHAQSCLLALPSARLKVEVACVRDAVRK